VKFAYVTDAGLNQVYKVDIANKTLLASLSVGKRPTQVPVHPTRDMLYIPCMESDAVYKIDLQTWKVAKIISVGKGPQGIAYTADGRYAYVTLTSEKPNGRVAVIDTETDTVQTTFPVESAPNGIALLYGKNQGW
jgi:YVTN family beta-propeller protein